MRPTLHVLQATTSPKSHAPSAAMIGAIPKTPEGSKGSCGLIELRRLQQNQTSIVRSLRLSSGLKFHGISSRCVAIVSVVSRETVLISTWKWWATDAWYGARISKMVNGLECGCACGAIVSYRLKTLECCFLQAFVSAPQGYIGSNLLAPQHWTCKQAKCGGSALMASAATEKHHSSQTALPRHT